MNRIQIILRFLKFYIQATTIYKIHSPFVFDLVENTLEDKRHFYAFSMIEPIRQMHLQNQHTIEVKDFGAGSLVQKSNIRKVRSIAKTAVSSRYRSNLLFRIINHFKPSKMLEMGTSLGISALYQSTASLNGSLVTLEGSHSIAQLAQATFKAYETPLNIELKIGEFNDTLLPALKNLKQVDTVFFDGNHQEEPTLAYFETCLKYAHEDSVFIFDDIYWSDGMQAAWEKIKTHPKVELSVDFFYLGMVFFRSNNKSKQHVKVVPKLWKPWIFGFFK